MGPWGNEGDRRTRRVGSIGGAGVSWGSIYLAIITIALVVLCAFALMMQRYQVSEIGTLPMRLDRFTGEVVSCIPRRGCFSFIPAGQLAAAPLSALEATPAPAAGAAPQVTPPHAMTNTPASPVGKASGSKQAATGALNPH